MEYRQPTARNLNKQVGKSAITTATCLCINGDQVQGNLKHVATAAATIWCTTQEVDDVHMYHTTMYTCASDNLKHISDLIIQRDRVDKPRRGFSPALLLNNWKRLRSHILNFIHASEDCQHASTDSEPECA